MKQGLWRTGLGALAVVGLLAVATPAAAHVTGNPREATAGSYARVHDVLAEALEELSDDERSRIFGGNAVAAYGLVL